MPSKRKLLFISAYTGLGGGESVQLNLMAALDPARFDLHLVCPRDGQLPDAARKHGVTVHILPYRGITTWFVPALWMRFPISRKLARLLTDLHIDAIHSDYHSLPFAVAAGRLAGHVPVIWNAMGWWFPAKPWQTHFFRDQVTQIIAITRAVRDRWLGDPPFMSPASIKVIVPGVDPAYYYPEADDGSAVRAKLGIGPDVPLVALIARFQQVKGHDIFQEMVRRVHAVLPNVHFAVAGENVFGVSKDETYKHQILETAQTDPVLRECLTYLGFWEDARQVIAAADVMVCPSRFESLGMVHLESMAMATPVVSMNNGGPQETVVDGTTGFLVPPEDPAALANAVITLLRDPARRAQMGQAGRAHVLAGFTAEGYARQFSDLVESLLE
ncbi:MAG TPA: glycosyltransferase family 4 protein [Aggregatilineaceae bacterium]|nr:glycosyltransferase family 4 protein [Aggregatilineaceae bacterium]